MIRSAGVCCSLALAVVFAACSGGDTETASAPPPTISDRSSATEPPEITRPEPSSSATAVAATRLPLTGEIVSGTEEALQRPALVVKIPVDPEAMPHRGLNDADIIFQTIINDGLTRYLAVFHSDRTESVGPVRSGRLQDVDIMAAFRRPLYAWSGGNAGVTEVMGEAAADGLIVDLNERNHSDLYRRETGRGGAPHNLFADAAALYAQVGGEAPPPMPVFSYLDADDDPDGEPAGDIAVTLDSIASDWTYDEASGRYLHRHNGAPHVTEFDGQVWADNVVVMMADYGRSPIDGGNPLMESLGSNRVAVFSGGTVREGVWLRFKRTEGWGLFDNVDDLNPIELVPGRTWVEMPRNAEENLTYGDRLDDQVSQ